MTPVVRLTKFGERRVLNGKAGMLFEVARYSPAGDGQGFVAHVIDPRYDNGGRVQIWSLGVDDWEPIVVDPLIKRIQDALGTEEEGEALVEVARAAHRAEQELAAQEKLTHRQL